MSERCPPYLEDLTTRMEERRCDLIGRQKYLQDKITTMERSIPALIAYNMWMAGQSCQDAPYCKVREIMNRFSPYPDPTDKLVEKLRNTVKDLNGETADLHEKIINTDVQLEETGMQLDSLELVNQEMNHTLNDLEKEIRSYSTPSLHSIHSEDLVCLAKIQQLAKEELNLKKCMKELEKKEVTFKEHIDRLLISKGHKNVCNRKMIKHTKNLESNDRRMHCVVHARKQSINPKRKLEQREADAQSNVITIRKISERSFKDQQDQTVEAKKSEETKEKRSSWISHWWNGNQKPSEPSTQIKTIQTAASTIVESKEQESVKARACSMPQRLPCIEKALIRKEVAKNKTARPWKTEFSSCKPCTHSMCLPGTPLRTTQYPHSCCVALNPQKASVKNSGGGKNISTGNVSCKKVAKNFSCLKITRPRNPFGELPPCVIADHGIRQACKTSASTIAPCDFGNLCEICPATTCQEYFPIQTCGTCRCNCRGKCAHGISDAPCNCSDEPLCPSDKGYQPTAPKSLNNLCEGESNSEDEFCDCCSCSCENSDDSMSCNCNKT